MKLSEKMIPVRICSFGARQNAELHVTIRTPFYVEVRHENGAEEYMSDYLFIFRFRHQWRRIMDKLLEFRTPNGRLLYQRLEELAKYVEL